MQSKEGSPCCMAGGRHLRSLLCPSKEQKLGSLARSHLSPGPHPGVFLPRLRPILVSLASGPLIPRAEEYPTHLCRKERR